jgi:hypothetical protein
MSHHVHITVRPRIAPRPRPRPRPVLRSRHSPQCRPSSPPPAHRLAKRNACGTKRYGVVACQPVPTACRSSNTGAAGRPRPLAQPTRGAQAVGMLPRISYLSFDDIRAGNSRPAHQFNRADVLVRARSTLHHREAPDMDTALFWFVDGLSTPHGTKEQRHRQYPSGLSKSIQPSESAHRKNSHLTATGPTGSWIAATCLAS